MPRDDAALLDILNAAKRAQRFVAGMSREEFSGDEKTRSAVLHQLMIVGEAAKRISSAYRDAHPEIPWRLMAGTRDTLIHEYDEVELDDVWDTVERDLPALVAAIEPLLTPTPKPPEAG
jgi:uncharacterized protein with HEPN domain